MPPLQPLSSLSPTFQKYARLNLLWCRFPPMLVARGFAMRSQNERNDFHMFARSLHSQPHFSGCTRPLPTTTTGHSLLHHQDISPIFRFQQEYPQIPDYLQVVYWWAYVLPSSIWLLDRQFLVNLVLWGNANTLRDATLQDLTPFGRTLQIACVYGNFTPSLWAHLQRTSLRAAEHSKTTSLDVIDVVPHQLESLQRKLSNGSATDTTPASDCPVNLTCSNAESLTFPDGTFDQAVIYMLLHEMPDSVRINAIREACRVLKSGGKLVFIDFHRPFYFWRRALISVWFLLEPFAKDMWSTEIENWIPEDSSMDLVNIQHEVYCGGLFQKVVITKF